MRSRWLQSGIAAIKEVRSQGVPVLGYTWFPLFTMIDWRYRTGRGPVEKYRLELGIYKLGEPGGPRWIPSPLVSQLQGYMNKPEEAVGRLRTEHDFATQSANML